jgi:fructose-bisphosphate aldolase class II
MPLESYDILLKDAAEKKYAIGAFNIFSLEFLPSILQAAEEESSPALLQINPIHFYLADLGNYLLYVKSQIAKTRVPIGLNLDHGNTKKVIMQGIQAGFPSVMFDGSKLPYEENLKKTGEISELCKLCNVTLEAELGTLNDEGLELTEENRSLMFTDPDKAKEFVKETGIHSLAVAIGNAHGVYKGDPKLDFDRLQTIKNNIGVPLVLHGGSGISDADFQKAIRLGISKINIYTEMSAASMSFVRSTTQNNTLNDYPTLLYQARQQVKNVVKRKMQIFNSSGKA